MFLRVHAAVLALEIGAVLLRVDQRGARVLMAHERLELVQGHPAAEAGSREGVPELVRIRAEHGALADLPDLVLDAPGRQPAVRRPAADEERRI